MATKMIKFDLSMKGIKVTSLEELQENFSADILPIFQTDRLAKWLMSRDLVAQAEAIAVIDKNSSELQQLAAICRVLELDDDEDVLQFLLDDRQAAKTAQTAASIPAAEVRDADAEDDSKPSPSDVDLIGKKSGEFTGEDWRKASEATWVKAGRMSVNENKLMAFTALKLKRELSLEEIKNVKDASSHHINDMFRNYGHLLSDNGDLVFELYVSKWHCS